MTYEETRQILTILKTNYPQSFRNMTKDESVNFLNLWSEAFANDPVKNVVAAVKSIIYSDPREFAPNIGQVKTKMHSLFTPQEMTEQEAWGKVRKACTNSLWHAEKEHKKLPELLQKLVSPEQLRSWAMMETDQLDTVVASNFMRSYKQRATQQKEVDMLPNEVKQMISLSLKMIGTDSGLDTD